MMACSRGSAGGEGAEAAPLALPLPPLEAAGFCALLLLLLALLFRCSPAALLAAQRCSRSSAAGAAAPPCTAARRCSCSVASMAVQSDCVIRSDAGGCALGEPLHKPLLCWPAMASPT